MLRSLLAVLAGYLIFAASAVVFFRVSLRDPHLPAPLGFVAVSILYGILFSALGGYVSALLGRRYHFEHSLAVATIIAVLGAASMIAEPAQESKWAQLGTVLIIAPGAMLGGYLRRRQILTAKLKAKITASAASEHPGRS